MLSRGVRGGRLLIAGRTVVGLLVQLGWATKLKVDERRRKGGEERRSRAEYKNTRGHREAVLSCPSWL